ncbi:MAG TPA: hypothetical protein VF043_05110 [Ktedonobacteraceae bacterium]
MGSRGAGHGHRVAHLDRHQALSLPLYVKWIGHEARPSPHPPPVPTGCEGT